MRLPGFFSRAPRPRGSAKALARFLADAGRPFEAASVREALARCLDFYGAQDVSGLSQEADADMLLFQYGCYDWGDGEFFQIGLTRQFIERGQDGDLGQLVANFRYEPNRELRALGDGHAWCHSRDELPAFREQVLGHAALAAAERYEPLGRSLGWDRT